MRDELYHYRTKGSKNGVSTDPNYTPIGQRAQGPAYMPGSTANRQYREQQQQISRIQTDAAIKRMKSSATNTANSLISGVNSAASKSATLAEDAAIRRELARREAEKKRQQWVQDRKNNWNRGVSTIKTGLTSAGNAALKKSGLRLQISDKRGVGPNPYEQGYTGTRRTKDVTKTNPQNAMNQRIAEARQLSEDKTGKNGRLAQAKAYGKEGFAAAQRIARNAKNLPGQAKSQYYKTKYNLSRDIDDLKREVTASDAYKRTKAGVANAASAAKSTMDKAAKSAEKAQKKASDLYERSKPGIDEAKTRVKEKASEAAASVGAEAERLKKKGLSLLKKLRK